MGDWYSIVKFLHVVSAILWVGGGFTLMVLAVRADRAGDIEGMLQAMRATGELGNRFFAPMSMLTLAFGLIMCWFWVGFDLWIVIGLAGYATTFCIGMFIFKPTADRMGGDDRQGRRHDRRPSPRGQRILSAARIDYSVMLVIIADMVLKPTLNDTTILGCMALVVTTGIALALGGTRKLVPSAA